MAAILLNKLQPGKTYTVAVKAIDSDGNVSPNSITYTFTTPKANLDGSQLVATNTTVVTAIANDSASVVGGALTAGSLDANGLSYAGKTNLATIWNSTSGGYTTNASLTSTTASAGAVIINSTGILGYQFGASNSGQANFFLNTLDGNAYFRGTVYAGAGKIGGWSIGENTLRSNTLTRNMILNSASNAISFTDISGSIIANIVSGSTTNPANFPLGEAFIIYSGSQIKYDGSLYPQVALQANNLQPIGTEGYLGVYSSSTTYLELDPTDVHLTANSAIYLATNGANITIQNNGVTGSIDLISKTRINIGNTSDMANKSIYIGYGTSSVANSSVYVPGVYYNTTGNTSNVYVSTSGLLYRSLSTFSIKENIFPLSKYSNLSEKIPKNKIIDNEIYDVEDVLKLTPVSFTSLIKEEFGKKYYGFIAEDVAEKTPNLATYDDYGNPIYYNINGIVASILAVVQNQQEKIEELEQRLASLENK